jgi:fatty-acyl-CoA synthase
MAAYKCPRQIVFVENLPKTGSGKVQWRDLADAERQSAAARTGT